MVISLLDKWWVYSTAVAASSAAIAASANILSSSIRASKILINLLKKDIIISI